MHPGKTLCALNSLQKLDKSWNTFFKTHFFIDFWEFLIIHPNSGHLISAPYSSSIPPKRKLKKNNKICKIKPRKANKQNQNLCTSPSFLHSHTSSFLHGVSHSLYLLVQSAFPANVHCNVDWS